MKTREELIKEIENQVRVYIDFADSYDSNPQLRINPESLYVDVVNGADLADDIEDSDEAMENAAIAQGAATKEDTDFQVTLNPDIYAVKTLVKLSPSGKSIPDPLAISRIVEKYY